MEDLGLIARGHAAQRLLEDPLIVETLDALESYTVSRLKGCDVNDSKTLQTLVLSLQAASGFRGQLQTVLSNGRAALEREDQRAEEGILAPLRRVFTRRV